MSEAYYYDGRISRPIPVKVKVHGDHLILYINIDGTNRSISYPINHIKVASRMAKDRITLKLNDQPKGPTLEWYGPDAMHFAEEHLRKSSRIGYLEYLVTHRSLLGVIVIALVLITASLWTYKQYLSPYMSRIVLNNIPLSYDQELGDRFSEEVSTMFTVDKDKSKLLQEFYEQLHYPSPFPVQMNYVYSDQLNAFAIPGGRIYFFSELIDKTDNWQELAAVLSHELAHTNNRHGMQSVINQLSSKVLIGMVLGSNPNSGSVIMNNASTLMMLSNTREFEKEADMDGLEYMEDQQINPQHMVDFFAKMKESEGMASNSRVLEFFHTHPLTDKRMHYLEDRIMLDSVYDAHPDARRLEQIWEELRRDDPKKDSLVKEHLDIIFNTDNDAEE